MTDHRPGCPLAGVPWLADAVVAGSDALAYRVVRRTAEELADVDVRAEVGLSDALRRRAPAADDRRLAWCTCEDAGA